MFALDVDHRPLNCVAGDVDKPTSVRPDGSYATSSRPLDKSSPPNPSLLVDACGAVLTHGSSDQRETKTVFWGIDRFDLVFFHPPEANGGLTCPKLDGDTAPEQRYGLCVALCVMWCCCSQAKKNNLRGRTALNCLLRRLRRCCAPKASLGMRLSRLHVHCCRLLCTDLRHCESGRHKGLQGIVVQVPLLRRVGLLHVRRHELLEPVHRQGALLHHRL